MISNEKYDLIVKLLKEGHTNRYIAREVHCSPNEITPIRKKIFVEDKETSIEVKNKSICAQVFDCLLKKIPLTQIVRDLDIEPEKVKNFHKEFLLLQNKDNLVRLLDRDKDYQDELLKLHDYLSINNIYINKVYQKIDTEKKLKELQEQNAHLDVTNFCLEESMKYWNMQYHNLWKKYDKLLAAYHKLRTAC